MSARQKLETQLTENNIVKEVTMIAYLLFYSLIAPLVDRLFLSMLRYVLCSVVNTRSHFVFPGA